MGELCIQSFFKHWSDGSLANIQIHFHAYFGADELLYEHKWPIAVAGIHEYILYLYGAFK